MSSCLGLYIENNIIKYAKVLKEHDNIKIESFGIKFDDNINQAVKQIISETNSAKIPISINLSDEEYTYANLFKLLKNKDLEKAVSTEFDFFCKEQKKPRNALEYRHIMTKNMKNEDTITCLYAYTDKSNILSKLQPVNGYRVTNLTPLAISIANLNKNNQKNSVIVNIDKKTSVTFMLKDKIQKVDTINIGMKEILDNIVAKEKSYTKAYEICKSTTLYTVQNNEIQMDDNEYMEYIIPTLYKIVQGVQKSISESNVAVDNIYITGLATAINNIDLYFQDNFTQEKCEILKPYFMNNVNTKINIKDYIEVNSAVALALEGVGLGQKTMNFKKADTIQDLKSLFSFDFSGGLDKIEQNMLRLCAVFVIIILVYAVLSNNIIKKMKDKNNEVTEYITRTENSIKSISNTTRLINERKNQYETLIAKIDKANEEQTQSFARKNALPNLLTEIMYNIPKEVQLISIQNTTDKSIEIQARSKEYEQLGYFIAKLKNEGILINITSDAGKKEANFVVIKITGELVY